MGLFRQQSSLMLQSTSTNSDSNSISTMGKSSNDTTNSTNSSQNVAGGDFNFLSNAQGNPDAMLHNLIFQQLMQQQTLLGGSASTPNSSSTSAAGANSGTASSSHYAPPTSSTSQHLRGLVQQGIQPAPPIAPPGVGNFTQRVQHPDLLSLFSAGSQGGTLPHSNLVSLASISQQNNAQILRALATAGSHLSNNSNLSPASFTTSFLAGQQQLAPQSSMPPPASVATTNQNATAATTGTTGGINNQEIILEGSQQQIATASFNDRSSYLHQQQGQNQENDEKENE